MDEGARRAEADDVGRIAELCAAAVSELTPGRGGPVFVAREAPAPPYDEWAQAALEDPCRRIWVGTIDEVVVGMAAARVEELRDGRRLGVIEALYVEPDARQVAIGEGLVTEVLTWCRARGCAGIDAHALPGARATKNFFEAHGFTARLLVVHRRLDNLDEGPGGD
jgi:GNAT superfamily N-acetyltransferase